MEKTQIKWIEVQKVQNNGYVLNLPTEPGHYFAQIHGHHGTKTLHAIKGGSGRIHFLMPGQGEILGKEIVRWAPIA